MRSTNEKRSRRKKIKEENLEKNRIGGGIIEDKERIGEENYEYTKAIRNKKRKRKCGRIVRTKKWIKRRRKGESNILIFYNKIKKNDNNNDCDKYVNVEQKSLT